MKRIIIPAFGTRISPRLDFANHIHIIQTEGKKIIDREVIQIITHNRLNRIHQIVTLNPDVIICDGLTDMCKTEFEKDKIKVIAWVHGEIDTIVESYLKGKLKEKIIKE